MEKYMILFCAVFFAMCFVGCESNPEEKESGKGKVDKAAPEKEVSPPAVPILYTKDQLKAIQQGEKLKANRDTRSKLNWGKGIAGVLILISGIAAFLLPEGTRKWGAGGAAAGVVLMIIFSCLSFYLELFNVIALIIILSVVGMAAVCGIMWARSHGFFRDTVNTNEKTKEKLASDHPEALVAVKDLWAKENDHMKAPIRAVKR